MIREVTISHRCRHTAILILIGFIGFLDAKPIGAQSAEYLMKAGFIEKFTRYIEWPLESAVTDTSVPFRITVIGDSPIDLAMEEYYLGQKIFDRIVSVTRIDDIGDLGECEILFIGRVTRRRLQEIIDAVKDKSVLTISESDGNAERGVAINFVFVEGIINFEMNHEVLIEAGFRVSSQLLRLAIIVKHFSFDGHRFLQLRTRHA